MDQNYQRINRNGVNGRHTIVSGMAVSTGQNTLLRQGVPVRHHATAGDDHARQVITHCNDATVNQKITMKRRIGAWNARSLLRTGKAKNVALEARRLKIDILGVSEVCWSDVGRVGVGGYEFIHSGGGATHRSGHYDVCRCCREPAGIVGGV